MESENIKKAPHKCPARRQRDYAQKVISSSLLYAIFLNSINIILASLRSSIPRIILDSVHHRIVPVVNTVKLLNIQASTSSVTFLAASIAVGDDGNVVVDWKNGMSLDGVLCDHPFASGKTKQVYKVTVLFYWIHQLR
jgi:hypothetical protein